MDLYKLALVDDEEDVRVSIAKKVDWNALGFELVGSVSNGEEALELAEQIHLDAVMTDIKMPFMDGLTLCAKLKENYKNTKVVLYSGFDDFELAREAIHLEAEEYLLKPISAKDLENVFGKVKENLDRMLQYNPDKIILGCTHYPFLLDVLTKFVSKDLFIDPSIYFAQYIKQDLEQYGLLNDNGGQEEFLVSANPEEFRVAAKMFYNLKENPKLIQFAMV